MAKVIHNWSRLISRFVLLIITVTKETVLDGWLQARGNAQLTQCQVEAPKDGRKGHHGSTEKGRVHTLIGHQLKPSQGVFPVERSLCKHARNQLVARGNRTSYWWTCKACGSRWARLQEGEVLVTEQESPENIEFSSNIAPTVSVAGHKIEGCPNMIRSKAPPPGHMPPTANSPPPNQSRSSSSKSSELPNTSSPYKAPPLKAFPKMVQRICSKQDSEAEDLRHVTKSRMVEEVKLPPRAVSFKTMEVHDRADMMDEDMEFIPVPENK